MRIYTWSDKRKEMRKCQAGMIVSYTLSIWYVYHGVAGRDDLFVMSGIALIFLTFMASALLMIRAGRMFLWCYGNTLEVKDTVVVRHHLDPFFYKTKELDGAQLIPLSLDPISGVKKIRIPSRRGILTYQIECVVAIDNLQRFYDLFLRKRGDELDTRFPRITIEEALSAILAIKRDELADLWIAYQREDFEIQAANIQMVTQHKVQRFLQENLVRYGLVPTNVRCACSIDPFIIE